MKNGWEMCNLETYIKLIDFCYITDFVANGSFASLRENVKYINNVDFAILIRLTDFTKKWKNDFVYVSKSSYDFLKKSSLVAGDLIMSNVGEPGIVFLVPDLKKPMTLGPNSILIRPNEKISTSKYLYLYFLSEKGKNQINDISTGAAQKKFNKTAFRNIEIPIPPLSEQQEIVNILDKAFEAINKAKANAEKNLKNAKELFESYLQNVFENKGEGWEEKKLGEVCKVERGSSPRPIDKYFTDNEEGVNWIKIGDTKEVDKYIYSTKQKITKEGALQSRFVDVGDFILSNSMSFGKPYIMKTQGYIHDGWFVFRLPKNIDTEFFWYLLTSPYTMKQFISLATGSIVRNISGDLVKKTILPIPPLSKQQEIVAKLDALSAETKRLEVIYKQKINDLEELKKSILQKAFNGELI